MNEAIAASEERMKKTINNLREEFAVLRTGRASIALFDKIRVDSYGEKTPLNQVANISIPEARQILISPWDKALIGEIEKAIRSSELSLNPNNDGKAIRIAIPPLTEQRRKELVKQAKTQAENSRVAIRNIRRDGAGDLKKAQKNGDLTEDQESRESEELQKLTNAYIEKINQVFAEKEKEIMED